MGGKSHIHNLVKALVITQAKIIEMPKILSKN